MTRWLVPVATAVVLLGVAMLPLLTPAWVGFEQGRAQVTAWTGWPEGDVRAVTDSIFGDLVLDRGDFAVTRDGVPVLDAAERSHMRDVRGVFAGFAVVALASLAILAIGSARARDGESKAAWWRAVRRGAAGLAIGVVVVGGVSLVAFDAAFELFHRLFFAAGTYDFDPRTSHLVQLFPDQFWSDTTLALGAIAIGLSAIIAWLATRQLASGSARTAGSAGVAGLRTREVSR